MTPESVDMKNTGGKPALEAPDFLVRLVGRTRANDLCRDKAVHQRRD